MVCVLKTLLMLALGLNGAAGQGYKSGTSQSLILGSSKNAVVLEQQLARSKNWRASWRLNPKGACNRAGSGSLCGSSSTEEIEKYAQLLLAASPFVYNSLEAKYVGNVRLVAPPGNQGPCSTCVAFAVASAAETAVATALRIDVQNCSISVQGLYFCSNPESGAPRACAEGWVLETALSSLQLRGHMIPTNEGLPYLPDTLRELTFTQMCDTKQDKPNPYLDRGRFTYVPLTSMPAAQEHIRQYGSIVSRFDVYDDFKEFFAKPDNTNKVYKPGPKANYTYGHAVAVVGYDNDNKYWLAKNSWGPSWADKGFFRVAYGSCSLVSEAGDVFGVIWAPYVQPEMQRLQVKRAQPRGCYWYTARPGDFPSMIAWRAGVSLARFLLNNTQTIKSLDASLDGQQVMLCDPRRDNIDAGYVDPQLQALLDLQKHIDQTGRMRSWTWESGEKAGYCNWQGVKCKTIDGTRYVSMIRIENRSRFAGLIGVLPHASVLLGLPGLARLVIREQQGIAGPLQDDWSNLAALKYLEEISLDYNSLYGTLPSSWGSLKQLKVLGISAQNPGANTHMDGPLPNAWANLTNLERLRLGGNFLSGTLPTSYSSMTQLQELSLWGNGLSGELPALWGTAFTKMESIEMGRCQIGGTIPATWGKMTKLKRLYLNENKFEGPLPDSFGNLTAISELGLYMNDLTGTVPISWGKAFERIQKLDLYDNPDLRGCLPGDLQQRLSRWGYDVEEKILQGTKITSC